MAVLRFVFGIILLAFGRKLFWLFVAGAGFVTAIFLVTHYIHLQAEGLIVLIAIGAGILGALLAVFLQRLAIGVGGFLAAGYGAVTLLQVAGVDPGRLAWVPFVIGGVIGAILMTVLFDWALIALSSLSGAALVAEALPLGRPLTAVVFFGALFLGIAVQSGLLMADRRREPQRERSERDRA
jgi:hypothetical protein